VERLLGIGLLVMIVADAVVGLKLLLRARRTGGIPELAFGGAFILLGAVGYPLSVIARKMAAAGGDPDGGLLAAALAAQNLGCLAMAVATWTTFRPDRRWAKRLVWGAAAAFGLSLLGDSLAAGRPCLRDGGPWYWVGFVPRALAFFWAAAEASRYHAMMRRRLPLGLADPVVTDRFRLWAISSAAVAAAFVIFGAARFLVDDVATSPTVLIATSLVGVVAGATVLLAFAPPAAYVRHVRSRADLSEGAAAPSAAS
jgi:hypothetical protein